MLILLPLFMAYSLVGEETHEWLDVGIFALFVLHNILNVRWSKALFKGKYTPYRIAQTTIVVLAMIAMLGSMISGISRGYMFLQIHFVFFDLDEPLILYLLDYIAVMGAFVCAWHYLARILKLKRSEF